MSAISTAMANVAAATAAPKAVPTAPKATKPTTKRIRTPKVAPKVQPASRIALLEQDAKRDKSILATKAETQLHRDFAAWILETTGVVADLKTVQLACDLRMEFQRSAANQASLATRRADSAKAKVAKDAAKKAKFIATAKALGLTVK